MGPKMMFTVDEIVGTSSSIPVPLDENSTLGNIVQSLHPGNFKTTKSYKAHFTSVRDDLFSLVTFTGKGFAFGLSKTKFASQFLRALEFVHSDPAVQMEAETPSKLFAKENLDQISSDFNYILGLILGKLNLDGQNYDFNFNITVSKEISVTHDLSYLLAPEYKTIFGDIISSQLQGINMNMIENLFDTQVQSVYYISENKDEMSSKNSRSVKAEFKLKHSGPVDFSKFVSESMNRLNNLTGSIMEIANESKS